MKKLFQKQKQNNKVAKDSESEQQTKQPIPTPLHQRLATHGAHLHGAISMPVFQQSTNQSSPTEWQKEAHQRKEQRDNRGKEPPRREDEPQGELTRMIGYLTATASQDWALMLEVCERASSTEASAKEAVRALRREFKYGDPAAQLSAAKVWAVMLRNSSEVFISQSISRKFLDTVEELLTSSRTSPVVRERLLEVVAAAAYASGSSKSFRFRRVTEMFKEKDGRNENQGFKGLWKRVKPFDKPDEGVPFDTEDAMFQPPQSGALSSPETPTFTYQEASPVPVDSAPLTPVPPTALKKRKLPSSRIIPPEEDMRRLFQECKIGEGNAAVLSDALLRAKPEDLKRVDVIKEFHTKCRASQELIYAQIPWATSIAERSRANKQLNNPDIRTSGHERPTSPVELTAEEKLLDALLAANEELQQVLKQWDDLHRLAIERKVEDRSRKEARLHPKPPENNLGMFDTRSNLRVSSSRTPSPASQPHSPNLPPHQFHPHVEVRPSSHSDQAQIPRQRPTTPSLYESDSDRSAPGQQPSLAPPPAPPHGPRSLAPLSVSGHSRTPSPSKLEIQYDLNGHLAETSCEEDSDSPSSLSPIVATQPSAKALGKRKADETVVTPGPTLDPNDKHYNNSHSVQPNGYLDPDLEDDDPRRRLPPIHFVYDAVAERTRKLLLDSKALAEQQQGINPVH